MKKIILAISVVLILLLDWAALHDILKANEPDYFAEGTVLVLSVLCFFVLGYFLFKPKRKSSNIQGTY